MAAHCVIRAIPKIYSVFPTVACLSSQSTHSRSKISIPLFLKPPKYSATFNDLQKWHSWATVLASSIGSSFPLIDNGPDSDLLKRELNWFLEDSLDDSSLSSQLRSTIENSPPHPVWLRLPLDDLYALWTERIMQRRPFQYLVGCEHWRDLVLCVQEGVLIPRPETELIIDLAEAAIKRGQLGNGIWADLGTGSGAIAIGIARILSSSGRVVAADLSPEAIRVASFNFQRYELQDKIETREGSWYDPLRDLEGKLEGIVSNPPYIPSGDLGGLQAEVGRHEPHLALDGGSSGMDCLQLLVAGAASMLKSGGFFAFETNGEKQCNSLRRWIEDEGRGMFYDVHVVPDFAGIHRFITGFRS